MSLYSVQSAFMVLRNSRGGGMTPCGRIRQSLGDAGDVANERVACSGNVRILFQVHKSDVLARY